MHERFRSGCRRVSAASASIQPEAEQNETPAAIRNQSRRVHMEPLRGEGRGERAGGRGQKNARAACVWFCSALFPLPPSLSPPPSMIRQKLAAIQQGPKYVPEGDAFVAAGFRSVGGDHLL